MLMNAIYYLHQITKSKWCLVFGRYITGGFPVEGAHTLQLGAAVWMNGTYPNLGDFSGGWSLAEEDISMTKRNVGLDPQCFNVRVTCVCVHLAGEY